MDLLIKQRAYREIALGMLFGLLTDLFWMFGLIGYGAITAACRRLTAAEYTTASYLAGGYAALSIALGAFRGAHWFIYLLVLREILLLFVIYYLYRASKKMIGKNHFLGVLSVILQLLCAGFYLASAIVQQLNINMWFFVFYTVCILHITASVLFAIYQFYMIRKIKQANA